MSHEVNHGVSDDRCRRYLHDIVYRAVYPVMHAGIRQWVEEAGDKAEAMARAFDEQDRKEPGSTYRSIMTMSSRETHALCPNHMTIDDSTRRFVCDYVREFYTYGPTDAQGQVLRDHLLSTARVFFTLYPWCEMDILLFDIDKNKS